MSESIQVQWDRLGDGTFDTDITAYVYSIDIKRGRETDLEAIGPGTATLVLKNQDGRFSADYESGAYHDYLEMYRRVRIKATVVGASTYGIFYGFVLGWDNKPRISEQTVTWYLGDRFALWEKTLLDFPMMRKVGTKCVLDLAINRAMGDNECANPSVETNLTGYSGLESVVPARDATMKIEGDYSVLCDCPGAILGEGWRFDATGQVDTGQKITARVWAKASETVTLLFRAYDSVLGVRGSTSVSVGTTLTLLTFPLALGTFQAASFHYFDLVTNSANEVMFWSDGLYFTTPSTDAQLTIRDLDAGTAEIELAGSYRRPALEVLQSIAQSEPRSFFFPYCGDTDYDERIRFYDLNHRAVASSATFSDDGSDVPYVGLVFSEQADSRISEAEVTSAGTYEDTNESATIWELLPTGQTIPASTTKVFHAIYSQPSRDCSLSVNPAGSATSYPIAANGNDGNIIKSGAAYPPVTTTTVNAGGGLLRVGQGLGIPTYWAYRGYLRFDTSAIGAGTSLAAARLRLKVKYDFSDTNFILQVRTKAWGATLEAGDWDGTGTVQGTFDVATLPPVGEWIEIDILTTGINKTAWTEFELTSDRETVGTTPTTHEQAVFDIFENGFPAELLVTPVGATPDSQVLENFGYGGRITIGAGALPLVVDVMPITGYPLKAGSEESRVVHASADPPPVERTLSYALPLQGTRTASMEAEAERLADWYDGPIRHISLTLLPKTDAVLTQMLSREIGDRVHVENTYAPYSTWIDADFWIEGIEHRIVPGVFHGTVFHLEESDWPPSAALSGTALASMTEVEVVTGGETIIITLTGETWVATVGEDNAITTALIAGIDSAQSEAAGWDAVVKANMVYTDVVRTSNTVVTITLAAEATYAITANETITVTIPATALTGNALIVATPTLSVIATVPDSSDDQIDTHLNDGYERLDTGEMYGGEMVEVATLGWGALYYWGGLRFDNGPLPPMGSTITAAYISIYIYSESFDDAYMDIYADDQAGPLAFTEGDAEFNISTRTRTTASAPWVADGLYTGTWVQSPSLVSVIQELVTAYDVTSIALILKPRNYVDAHKTLLFYANERTDGVLGAQLHIEWEE